MGPAGASGTGAAAGVAATEAVTGQVLELARQLKEGKLKSRDEATKKLVSDILKEKVRSQSKQLSDKIFEQLKDDPHLKKTLDRMWSTAEKEE